MAFDRPVPRRSVLALALGAVAAAVPAFRRGRGQSEQEESRFIEDLGDVPLMPGLTVVEDAGMAFDAAAGRIVEVFARGEATAEEVGRFYAESLPSLGWQAAGESIWRREGEVLRLETGRDDAGLFVRFLLTPS